MKVILIALLALGLTNCAQTNYKVNKEVKKKEEYYNQVPQWYIDAKIDKGFCKNSRMLNFIYTQ